MIKLYLWAEKIWFRFPQKVRFLLVGGFNTVLAYVVLNVLNFLFGIYFKDSLSQVVIANIALVVQNILTINVSFITMRYYVFQSHGPWVQEWLKAWTVYVPLCLVNSPCLTFMMVVFGWPAWLAQGVYLVFSTILTFILHKYYSFKKSIV